jgi:hypothetical protein
VHAAPSSPSSRFDRKASSTSRKRGSTAVTTGR